MQPIIAHHCPPSPTTPKSPAPGLAWGCDHHSSAALPPPPSPALPPPQPRVSVHVRECQALVARHTNIHPLTTTCPSKEPSHIQQNFLGNPFRNRPPFCSPASPDSCVKPGWQAAPLSALCSCKYWRNRRLAGQAVCTAAPPLLPNSILETPLSAVPHTPLAAGRGPTPPAPRGRRGRAPSWSPPSTSSAWPSAR